MDCKCKVVYEKRTIESPKPVWWYEGIDEEEKQRQRAGGLELMKELWQPRGSSVGAVGSGPVG
jgi:hypothetical protein